MGLRSSSVIEITSVLIVICVSTTIMCCTIAEAFSTRSRRTKWDTHRHGNNDSHDLNIPMSSQKMRNIFGFQDDNDDRHDQDPEEENATPRPTKPSSSIPSRQASNAPSYLPSLNPTISPTKIDSLSPSSSVKPSRQASDAPSYLSSLTPNISPTKMDSLSPSSSVKPSRQASNAPSYLSSLNPTISPTKMDSLSPSLSVKPSRQASDAPSYLSSLTPTISPTKIDSLSPSSSVKPSRQASDAPSYLPTFHRKSNAPTRLIGTTSPDDQLAPSSPPQIYFSVMPSIEPSKTFSAKPTASKFFTAPSSVPTSNLTSTLPPTNANRLTSAPSNKPTIGRQSSARPSVHLASPTNAPKISCENITSTGVFGNISLGSMEILSYNYDVEIDPLSDVLLEEEIIPRLESKMLNFLLAGIYFRDDCPNGRRLRAVDKNLINLIGMSSSPNDKIWVLEDCSDTGFEDSKCTPVEGRMSIYLPQPAVTSLFTSRTSLKADETPSLIIEMLKEGMDSDKFLDAHSAIRKVVFVGPSSDIFVDTDIDQEPIELQRNNLALGLIAMFFFLSSIFCFTIFFVRRGRVARTNRETSDLGLGEAMSFDSDEVLDSEIHDDVIDLDNPLQSVPAIKSAISTHDEVTVQASNRGEIQRGDDDHQRLWEDLTPKTINKEKDALFDFFDLILESTGGGALESEDEISIGQRDDFSEISF